MSEGSKVRLVRCPNCDNLLPELPEYSVYQCGGCGTILRAKKKDLRSDILSEKSNEEKGFLGSEKPESSIEKSRDIINSFTSEPETEANSGTKSNWRRKEKVFTDKNTDLVNTRFRRPDKREEDFGTFSDEFKDLRLDRSLEDRYNNNYITNSKPNQANKFAGSLRTRPRMDFSGPEASRFEGIAGPSNYDPYPYPIGVEKLEQERAELIRKLDELKDQLTRPYQEREPFPDRNLSGPYPNPRPPQYFDQVPNFYSPRTHIHQRPPPMPPQPLHQPHFSPREYYPDPFEYYHAPPRVPQPYSNGGGPANHISSFYRHDEPVVTVEPPRPPRGGYYHDRPRRTVRSRRRGVLPIAGGAPFVACQKCFEVLKLPRKKIIGSYTNKNQKLRCGGCSTVVSLKVESGKKIVTEVVNSVESTEDFKQPSFDFHPAVAENGSLDERLSLEGSEKRKVYSSSPSVSSREEESLPSAVSHGDNVSEHVEDFFPSKKPVPSPVPPPPPPPRSPTWHQPAIGTTSKGTEENKDDDDDDVERGSAGPTEMDVPFEEYQHNNMSVDFAELSREDYETRSGSSKENSDSFLVGFIKKGFRDISRSSHSDQTERPKVYINGHPLSDRVVKRAEKYAGTIRPGDYWYDYKGGFWGVMGQPCLGIIPPYIEEFNYPMPTNCGAGNTCVYVNGRELHQRDLDLLSSRGLPTARNKFYIVEINGRVVDEDSGKELDNLGKLAPTVEKVKRGFGMKVPRVVTT